MLRWDLVAPSGSAESAIDAIAALPAVSRALALAGEQLDECTRETVAIAEIPSPTFSEGRRAQYVGGRLHALGAQDVHEFGHGNIAGRFGTQGRAGIALIAHLDTVFAETVSHTVTQRDGRLYGPGVGDNAAGIAGSLMAMAAITQADVALDRPVWVIADVGEEGLGDLLGVRETIAHFSGRFDALLAIEGTMLGRLGHISVGSRRLRVRFQGPGGHSWLDFGTPSAVHAAVRVAGEIADLHVPTEPRTTFNIGRIEGGDGVNIIAPSAEFLLDMRAVNADTLDGLVARVQAILERARAESGITIDVDVVGDRPAGSLSRGHPLVEICAATLRHFGIEPASTASSTDANIAMSAGIPSLAVGITHGAGIHSPDEWIEVDGLSKGVQQLVLLCAALAGVGRGQSGTVNPIGA